MILSLLRCVDEIWYGKRIFKRNSSSNRLRENPLFALPLYANGLGGNSVLLYRYLSATIIYGLWLKLFKQISFKITFKEFLGLFLFAVIFAYSDIFIFEAFKYMDSGLACTILFVYPLIVALISKIIITDVGCRLILKQYVIWCQENTWKKQCYLILLLFLIRCNYSTVG